MQTEATKLALQRDSFLCQWCLEKDVRQRHVFAVVLGYDSRYGGGHHVFKRSSVDEADAIVALCCKHHYEAEIHLIRKRDLVELLSKIVGYDVHEKYREFCDW